jgi:hypothetical protein
MKTLALIAVAVLFGLAGAATAGASPAHAQTIAKAGAASSPILHTINHPFYGTMTTYATPRVRTTTGSGSDATTVSTYWNGATITQTIKNNTETMSSNMIMPPFFASAASVPLRGCYDIDSFRTIRCPTPMNGVSIGISKPSASAKRGTTMTFRARVSDKAKPYNYNLWLQTGWVVPNGKSVVRAEGSSFDRPGMLTWKAKPGRYLICLRESSTNGIHPDAYVCQRITVR